MSRKPELQELTAVAKPKFDPNKAYTWPFDAKFVLTGKEIEILSRALVIQTTNEGQYQKYLWLQESLITLNKILEESYNEGIIQERKQEATPPMRAVAAEETAVQEKESEPVL